MLMRILQQNSVSSKIILIIKLDNSQSDSNPLVNEKKCDLFGSFSFIVQVILGVLSFMVLVCKIKIYILSKKI
jgi:hypothetical protein